MGAAAVSRRMPCIAAGIPLIEATVLESVSPGISKKAVPVSVDEVRVRAILPEARCRSTAEPDTWQQ
jgi:hypothetical protein